MNEQLEKSAEDMLAQREKSSTLQYDDVPPAQAAAPKPGLGKASSYQQPANSNPLIPEIESPWKILPLSLLPSGGFAYPAALEISIKPATVDEIKYWSAIDENDPLDLDDKFNHILQKCARVKYEGGVLSHLDIHQEDRFFLLISIRDLTFIKGENKLLLTTITNCKKTDCNVPKQLELKANMLAFHKINTKLRGYFSEETLSFVLTPKNGDEPIEMFVPSIGVNTLVRKILKKKKQDNKQIDESFASIAPFVIPNWKDLTESMYDRYFEKSKSWTVVQFSILDGATKMLTFATKPTISFECNKCGAEVAAPVTFPEGYRSIFVISDFFAQLL